MVNTNPKDGWYRMSLVKKPKLTETGTRVGGGPETWSSNPRQDRARVSEIRTQRPTELQGCLDDMEMMVTIIKKCMWSMDINRPRQGEKLGHGRRQKRTQGRSLNRLLSGQQLARLHNETSSSCTPQRDINKCYGLQRCILYVIDVAI